MQKVFVYSNALARYVSNASTTAVVSERASQYDRAFKKGGVIEKTYNGDYRLMSNDEVMVFNIPAAKASDIFKVLHND